MIVVDSSALIAVLFEEPEKQAFQEIIDGDEPCILSAVNAHETACAALGTFGPDSGRHHRGNRRPDTRAARKPWDHALRSCSAIQSAVCSRQR